MTTTTQTTARPTVALVTGATRGLGLETTRRLAALGWTVYLGARDLERGREAATGLTASLTADGAGSVDIRALPLDVTSEESVTSAVGILSEEVGRLDVLVNNAGVAGEPLAPEDTAPAHFLQVFGVNVLGPVRVTSALLPLLRAAEQPRVVMVSSGRGSFALTSDPARIESGFPTLVYPSSKAALNMITTQYAKALPGIQVNAADPGLTATDLTGHRGHKTVTEGTDAIVFLATLAPDGPTGTFVDRDGQVAW